MDDRDTWIGRRDHALLLLAIQTGLRVTELTSLTCADVELGTGAHLRCHGKGRKERITQLGVTGSLLRTVMSTNPVESMIEIVRSHARNVKRWQPGDVDCAGPPPACSPPRHSSDA